MVHAFPSILISIPSGPKILLLLYTVKAVSLKFPSGNKIVINQVKIGSTFLGIPSCLC